MPGLVGIVSNNTGDEKLLDQMIYSIKHKPWQKIDKFDETPFRIARVHLGIFNPEPEPIFNEDKTLCAFIYGKIYGYEGQRKNLEDKHRFMFDNNDAEFCLHAYEEYGTEFVKKLNGTFVLVICNLKKKEIVIMNDRYGLRPLYYLIAERKVLLFASEIKAILQDSGSEKRLNEETVADFFAFGEIFGNKTFFKGIEVMPPASIIVYNSNNFSIRRYWDFSYQPDYNTSEDELADKLVETFKEALKIRMKGNLRYAVALSGGLDSRAIVSAIDREKRKDLVTFTFAVPGCEEDRIARIVAKAAGTKHRFIPLDPDQLLSPCLEEVVHFTEGEFPVHIPQETFVYEKMKPFVDVIIDGTGGPLLSGHFLSRQMFKVKDNEEILAMLYGSRVFSDEMMSKLFTDNYYKRIKGMPLQSVKEGLGEEWEHPCNKYDHFMIQNRTRRCVSKGGSYIMLNTEEFIPINYDYNFIDVILSIPPELRFQHHIHRKFLKKLDPKLVKIPYNLTMIRADAPQLLWSAKIKYRNGKARLKRLIWNITGGKLYFEDKRHYAPVGEWLRVNQNWRRFARDTLLSQDTCIRDFCRQEFVGTLIKEHESGKTDHFHKIICLLTFELFLKIFVTGSLALSEY